MRTSSVEMALPYARTGKENKYACCKSSSASSKKKIIQKFKNVPRNLECIKKNAKLTSTNP